MTQADELKSCPFCGKSAVYMHDKAQKNHGVRCDNEFCIAYYLPDATEQGYYTKEFAYEAWNTRTPHPDTAAVKAAVEAMTEAVRELEFHHRNHPECINLVTLTQIAVVDAANRDRATGYAP